MSDAAQQPPADENASRAPLGTEIREMFARLPVEEQKIAEQNLRSWLERECARSSGREGSSCPDRM